MNEDFSAQDDLPVSKVVLSNAVPAMIGMIMVLVYNLADLFFIGQTGDDLKVAAISMATPVFLMFMSLGNVFGNGGASMLARSLGSGKHEMVNKISSFCFWSCVVVGIGFSLITFLCLEPLVEGLGASGETADMVITYLQFLCGGGVFILISNCFSALIRAEGKPEKAMIGMMLGNLVNIILDPIFILTLDMGVSGAALATFLGNICGGAYYLFYLFKTDTILSIAPSDFTIGENIPKEIFIIGVPASLSSVLMGVSQMLINGQMAQYGDLAVAGIGVALKVTMITTMVCIGIGMGVQPILGYAIGANNEERYNEIFKFSMIFSFVVSGILTILCYLFLNQIVGGFVSDPESFDYGYQFAQVLISTSVVTSMLYTMAFTLQAAGAATPSLIINLSKYGIIYIPLLFLLGETMGINGLVYAQPVADVLTFILAIVLYKVSSKNFFSDDEEEEYDEEDGDE